MQTLWDRTERSTGCWLWTGYIDKRGYGRVSMGARGTLQYAHRVSWELANQGRVPPGMCVLHACDTPACIRPDHLWIGTRRDNNRDRAGKGRSAKTLPSRRGERNPMARLSDEQVEWARAMLASGKTQRVVAEYFRVHPSTISLIASGKRR